MRYLAEGIKRACVVAILVVHVCVCVCVKERKNLSEGKSDFKAGILSGLNRSATLH